MLFILVAMLPLIAIAMVLLSSGTRTLLGETKLAKRQADERYVLASATAWVRRNEGELAGRKEGFLKQLDMTEFGLKDVECSVAVKQITEDKVHVTIKAVHARTGRTWRERVELAIGEESGAPEETGAVVADPNEAGVR